MSIKILNKVRNCVQILLVTSLLIWANVAQANNESTFYTGAKLGWTHFGNGCESHNLDCDIDALGGGVFLGYQINSWLAAEGGYDYFGKAKAVYPALGNSELSAPYSSEVQGLELALKANYSISEKWSAFAKGGSLVWSANKIGLEINESIDVTDRDASIMLGAGFDYSLSSNLITRIEYQWFNNVGGENTGGSDIHWLTVGVVYSFNSSDKYRAETSEEHTPISATPIYTVIDETNGKTLFAFDSYKLTENMKEQLKPMLIHLMSHKKAAVTVVGHTDSTGKTEYNKTLSQRRANSVAQYLIDNGINSERIQVLGMGENQPVADNSTQQGRAKNRRVELVSPSYTKETMN